MSSHPTLPAVKMFKKHTITSLFIWAVAAFIMIAYQNSTAIWPALLFKFGRNATIFVALGLLALSTQAMRSVPSHEIFPSKSNKPSKNMFLMLNFGFSIIAAICFFYISGLIETPHVASAAFLCCTILLMSYLVFQIALIILGRLLGNNEA